MAVPRHAAGRITATQKPVQASLDWRGRMADRVGRTAPRLAVDIESRAACTGLDTDLFFPRENSAAVDAAKAVCQGCAVMRACLMQALRTGDEFAVLGGTTPTERRLIRLRLAERKRELGVAA